MATVMTGAELARRCLNIANNYKTLYVYSCFGSPMTAENKKRYTTNCAYNKKAERTRMIKAASADTFGFDCVNLIKGILWGWNGNKNATYGGARYAANGVPDVSANGMIQKCYGVTSNFSHIEVGEVVWMDGHIGVYVGNGLAVECSPRWKNCVQVTAVGNIGSKRGYNTRTWTKHGKMPYVSYTGAAAVVSTPKVANGENPYQYPQGNISYGYSSHHYGAIHTGIEGIKAIQFDLQKLGLYQDAIDGFYGRKTEAAVTQFQKTHKDINGNQLEADGWAGPLTRGAIQAAVKSLKKTNPYRKPTMVLNASNAAYGKKYAGWDEVKHIHWGLKELGLYNDDIDGYFGPKTTAAVMQFQRTHGGELMTKKRVKRITIRIAGKEATRKTGVHTLKTALEAFCGVLAAGLGDVFAKDIFSPEARIALASLLALAVSTAVTAFLNEDQRLRRSTRTFIQVFVGTIAAGVAAVLTDYGTPAFRTGFFSLIVVAASTALAAVMNLQTPSGGGEVVPTEKGGD